MSEETTAAGAIPAGRTGATDPVQAGGTASAANPAEAADQADAADRADAAIATPTEAEIPDRAEQPVARSAHHRDLGVGLPEATGDAVPATDAADRANAASPARAGATGAAVNNVQPDVIAVVRGGADRAGGNHVRVHQLPTGPPAGTVPNSASSGAHGLHLDAAVSLFPYDRESQPDDDVLGAFAAEHTDDRADSLIRRRRIRTVAIIGIVAVLACVGVVLGPTSWDLIRERNARIATPHEVAGLTLDESDNAKGTADYLKTAVETGISFDDAIGAVYTDGGAEPRSVIFVGGTGLFMTPDKELKSLFSLITDQTGGVDQVRAVPAGSLGGLMKCGMTSTDDGSMAVCGWADHGSVAVALFPDRGVDESAALMRQMRHAMQRRG